MTYTFWYDVAEYMNELNRGKFTARELAENAFELYESFRNCIIFHKVMPDIAELVEQLKGTTYAEEIESEIEYFREKGVIV